MSLNKNKLSLAVAFAASLAATCSFAQDVKEVEEVVVTGLRASLANSLNSKRESVGAADSVYAEDIGDFPDTNLAESLQRVPGVSISREGGEGRQVSVRGLGPDFTRVRINGMEAMATTGGTDSAGGANRGRAFDFNTFAAELFTGLTVAKTASANLEEGSLGATIDLSTAKPLDFKDPFTLRASAKASINELTDDIDPRLTVLVAGMNDSETIGWSASLATSQRNRMEEGYSTVRWSQEQNFGACTDARCVADPELLGTINDAMYPRIPRYDRFEHSQDRTGFTGTLQFQPSDSTEILVDYLYSKTESTRREEFLELSIKEKFNAPNATITDFRMEPGAHDGMQILSMLELDGVQPRIENRFDEMSTTFDQFSVRLSHDFNDTFHLKSAIGTSKSDYSNPIQTTIIYDAPGINDFKYDYGSIDGREPSFNWGTLKPTETAQWLFTEARDRPNSVTNQFTTLESSLQIDLEESFSVEVGFNYKEYQFEVDENRRDRALTKIQSGVDANGDPTYYSSIQVTDDMVNTTSVLGTSWITPKISQNAALVDFYNTDFLPERVYHQKVNEDDFGVFLQANWNSELAGMPFRGNIGVRRVQTSVKSEGVTALKDIGNQYVTLERNYANTLPSLNMSLDVTDSFVVRYSWAEVMTRPSLGSLTPGGKVDTFGGKIDVGNPGLDPFLATATDISFEWYFAEESLLSLALFEKNISSFIESESYDVPYSETGYPAELLSGGTYGWDDTFNVKSKTNGDGGSVNGYEIIYQQPFFFLPGEFANFGFQGNFTSVESEVNYGLLKGPLNGQSDTTVSATLYFENDVISTRISAVNRSGYLTDADGTTGKLVDENGKYTNADTLTETGVKGTTYVDLSVTYHLNDNIDISLEGNNLTDEYYDQYVDSSDMTYVYHHTGASWSLGASYKF